MLLRFNVLSIVQMNSLTVEMLHTSPSYDGWYCDFDQLLRGELLGA